jgi:CheY-like chemotaxis protein
MIKVFTTGQAAKVCRVTPRVIRRCFDSGLIKGYRIPGSHDRRIPREYLIRFLKEHGLPLGDLEVDEEAKVLIVSQDDSFIESLKQEMPTGRCFKFVSSGFSAGIEAACFHPDCIVVDFAIGRFEALQICKNARRNAKFDDVILIALLSNDGNSLSFDRSTLTETFKRPFAVSLFADRLRTLFGWGRELA